MSCIFLLPLSCVLHLLVNCQFVSFVMICHHMVSSSSVPQISKLLVIYWFRSFFHVLSVVGEVAILLFMNNQISRYRPDIVSKKMFAN